MSCSNPPRPSTTGPASTKNEPLKFSPTNRFTEEKERCTGEVGQVVSTGLAILLWPLILLFHVNLHIH